MRRALVVGSVSLACGAALACCERPPRATSAAKAPITHSSEGGAANVSERAPSTANAEPEATVQLPRSKRVQGTCGGGGTTGVWRTDSEEIKIREHHFFNGSRGFRADCSLLSNAQLKLLAELELVPGQESVIPCSTDPTGYTIEVRGTNGNVRSYLASSSFGTCKGDPVEYVSIKSIAAFMASVPCLRSRQVKASNNPTEDAPSVGVNDGCEHAFFGGPNWVRVKAEDEGTYTFEGIDCGDARFTLFDPKGKTIVSRGRRQPAPGCWRIARRLEQPGEYLLKLEGSGPYYVRMSSGRHRAHQ